MFSENLKMKISRGHIAATDYRKPLSKEDLRNVGSTMNWARQGAVSVCLRNSIKSRVSLLRMGETLTEDQTDVRDTAYPRKRKSMD